MKPVQLLISCKSVIKKALIGFFKDDNQTRVFEKMLIKVLIGITSVANSLTRGSSDCPSQTHFILFSADHRVNLHRTTSSFIDVNIHSHAECAFLPKDHL